MNQSRNPFNVKLVDVIISKFNGTDRMSILPQVGEFTFYQSIFSSLLKADLVVSDLIGLMNNYPLSGEEAVEVVMSQDIEQSDNENASTYLKTLYFVITAIKEIQISDDSRQSVYIIELASQETLPNALTRVSHAYFDNIENMIKDLYEKYISAKVPHPKTIKFFPDTEKIRKLVVPNIKPFDAIAWMCKYAISKEPTKYYTHAFYETLENFTFKTLQKPTFRDAEDEAAYMQAEREKFFYVSNLELIKKDSIAYERLLEKGFSESRSINDLKINKRYSAFEKIVGGYYENEFIEVNMLQKDHKITYTELDEKFTRVAKADVNSQGAFYNTDSYIDYIKKFETDEETSSRIRYIINNYDDANQPSYRDKFGPSSRSFLAFQQVDLSIAIPSNLLMRPGDLIYVELPEFHGFNANEPDKYLSGHFMTSEIKTILGAGGRSQSFLRINKDAWSNKLEDRMTYNVDSGQSKTFPLSGQ